MLKIYKASAGSGKTFSLVVEFLKLILVNENNYRHILAVTFTNRATAEMKERVIEQLNLLTKNLETPYRKIIIDETGLTSQILQQKAERVLEKILFDFNRFSVSTIDKFTQRVIKAFNRETGITPNYQLETDIELLVSEAVDRLIATIGTDKKLRKWLMEFVEEKIRENKNFGIEKDLKELGKELFKEIFQDNLSVITGFFATNGNNENYLKLLRSNIYGFEQKIIPSAAKIVAIYQTAGYTSDDFSYKEKGVAGALEKIDSGEIPAELGKRILDAAESPGGWVTKGNKNQALVQLVTDKLQPDLAVMTSYFIQHSRTYNTAKVIMDEWFTLAVLVDLNNEVAALAREKGVLPLAGSNLLLKAIIDGNDSPFIYEKTGNTYYHFMLDEFQDTSGMQWENFKPLIDNSMGMQKDNLVVGDVKQSIYRWRNSNWKIMASQVEHDFSRFEVKTFPLDINYRSDGNIIHFNNNFFINFVENMKKYENLKPCIEIFEPVFNSIYQDIVQKAASTEKEGKGFVSIEQIESTEGVDEEKFVSLSLKRLVEQVKELQTNGFKASEIAILVRRNLQGAQVVQHFLDVAGLPENQLFNLTVLSNDSLFLKSSAGVNFVVSFIRHLFDPEDSIACATVNLLYKNFITPSLAHDSEHDAMEPENAFAKKTELVSKLMQYSSLDEIIVRICSVFGLFEISSEIPFIQSLLDKVAGLKKSSINDFSGFLKWWEENGSENSVNVNDEADAIRLLTIHKAKGLEFKAVLIPFFDWPVSETNKKNILWCTPLEPPFNQAPLVPVNFNQKLASTIFEADYYLEVFNRQVDHLNMVYVAFTRAKSVLMVNFSGKATNGSIGSFLKTSIGNLLSDSRFRNCWNEDEKRFTIGKMPQIVVTHAKPDEKINNQYRFTEFSSRLKLRTNSDDFLKIASNGVSRKNFGIIIHTVLSGIKTTSDIDSALANALAARLVQPHEMETLQHKIGAMVNHPLANEWFSGLYQVLTETDLLTPEKTYRPDRIMLKNDLGVIIDFKTGITKRSAYQQQVMQYARTLKNTGLQKVEGYLWFLESNDLEKVCEI